MEVAFYVWSVFRIFKGHIGINYGLSRFMITPFKVYM